MKKLTKGGFNMVFEMNILLEDLKKDHIGNRELIEECINKRHEAMNEIVDLVQSNINIVKYN